MLFSKKSKITKSIRASLTLAVIFILIYSYLYVDGINVFIETNKRKQEDFIITTAINYSEIMNSTTRGRKTELIKSNTKQRVPIHLDNLIFFNTIYAVVYHPDYLLQQMQYGHRSLFRTVDYPKFKPKTWRSVINNNQKMRISEVPMNEAYPREALLSGKIVRIADVLGHLRTFKDKYIPILLARGKKERLQKYIPRLKEIVAYTKANTEVSYEKLPKFDQDYLLKIDQELQDIEVILR